MILLFILATVALAALGLAAYVCWWLWRKSPYGRVAAVAIPAFVIYHCITAVFPPAAFYREEFADRTSIAMPPSAKMKFKKASFPDFHGDYASELLFEV